MDAELRKLGGGLIFGDNTVTVPKQTLRRSGQMLDGHNDHRIAMSAAIAATVCTEVTDIHFRELSDSEIYAYIRTGEPMDKAGAYGIQGLGGKFVADFDGEFESIMGLSISLTKELLEKARQVEK